MKHTLFDRIGHDNAAYRKQVETRLNGGFQIDNQGEVYCPGALAVEDFTFIPTVITYATASTAAHAISLAVGSRLLTLGGTGTVEGLPVRNSLGGATFPTRTTSAAQGDQIFVKGAIGVASNSNFSCPIRAGSLMRFRAVANLTTITTIIASVGLNENVTDPDPSGTAGDGAMFLFVPAASKADLTIVTGFTDAQHANWIIAEKVNGVDEYTATSVPVVAGQDYELVIDVGADLLARYYIDGVLVHTGDALTSGDILTVFAGVETRATSTIPREIVLRTVELARQWG